MYLQKIRNIIGGYVKIRAEGYYIEKFINGCRKDGYVFEKIRRPKDTIMEANVFIKDFKNICDEAKKCNCRIKILQKKGIPFFIDRYKKRKLFIALLFIVVGTLIVLSNFVWNIEVTGNSNISAEDIIAITEAEGLKIGKYKKKINSKKIVEKIREERSDVSWVRNEAYWNKCCYRNC